MPPLDQPAIPTSNVSIAITKRMIRDVSVELSSQIMKS